MYSDGEACKRSDILYLTWKRNLDRHLPELAQQLAPRREGEPPVETAYYSQGAFNRCYRGRLRAGSDVLIRFPVLGRVSFRREKLADEVSVMEYVAQHTSISVPKILRVGTCAWGPFMVTSFVEGNLLSECLKAPSGPTELEVLNPDISASTLKQAYRGMAETLIELSKCQFPRIGAVTRDKAGSWGVGKRAVSLNMNQLVALGNYPPQELGKHTFATATDYFVALAQDHMRHLETQRNDAIDDEADCKKKYVARCLFLDIARTFSTTHNNGPFRLFSEDLRPSNVIVGPGLEIRCVIDWEFSYVCPAEFTYCSPWWLLLAHPDDWQGDFDDFLAQYLPRHNIFLGVLQECEDEVINRGALLESQRLSERMAQSMHNGDFWFCLAARSSFAFDDIYWRYIDPKYHGEFTSVEDRVKLLSSEEQARLEGFVQLKMQQARERKLEEHWTLDEILAA
jgi:hypothetical protein